MKTLKRNLCPLSWIIICILIFSSSECMGQLKMMTIEDLALESTSIAYGKCSSVKSEWNEDHSIIFTQVTLAPEGYVKGSGGAETIITVPGGRIGDIIYEVSEMPVFEEGEEVLTFIYQHPSGKKLVTGGFQGKLKIEKDEKTGERVIKGISFNGKNVTRSTKGTTSKSEDSDNILLKDFLLEIEGYVKK